jgi:spermidine synthase
MNRQKLCLLLISWAIVSACGKLSAADKTLYRKASHYATLVVTEDDNGLRTLRFGDDPDAQSIVKVGDPDHVVFEYVQAMPVALTLVKDPQRVLIVGLGGGSLPSLLRKHYPKMTIDVVDIDSDVVAVAKQYFGFHEDPAMRVYVEDGRRFIERCKQPYDIIFLDAYGPENIPYSLATKEFLLAVRRAVGTKGIVAGNVWSQTSNTLHDAMLRTYQEAFDDLYVVDAAPSENEIFLAFPHKERIDRDDLARRASKLCQEQKFRFDIGQYVTDGLHHEDQKDPRVQVLLDKPKTTSGAEDRACWCEIAGRLADPVLGALARRKLAAEMPVEHSPKSSDRSRYTYLEALSRLLCGLAPWIELGDDGTPEGAQRAKIGALARTAIGAATDPQSPDRMNFSQGGQPLVDAAFLAQAMRRSPRELWAKLEPRVQKNVISSLAATRSIRPGNNNWKLFATTIEVFMQGAGEKRDESRLFEGIKKHQQWYVGDGAYGDGPEFHWDYYNSFVIQPMLLESLDVVGDETGELKQLRSKVRARLTRWAAIQERLIAPDGTYPVVGRSMAYRCGAFQGLALAALRKLLPADVTPAQARVALTSVIHRTLEAPGTWDEKGWLQIGLAGHQPALGETYISTGSLYLCSTALLPLGLPANDPFWTDPPAPTTWQKAWSGYDQPADHALSGRE